MKETNYAKNISVLFPLRNREVQHTIVITNTYYDGRQKHIALKASQPLKYCLRKRDNQKPNS